MPAEKYGYKPTPEISSFGDQLVHVAGISRRFIDSLADRGPFFQSPYPDFYATNVAFLKARRLL